MLTTGRVISEGAGSVTIATSRPPADNLSDQVTVVWMDKRLISPEQRRKAYALMGEISAWSGDTPENVKACMKMDFRRRVAQGLTNDLISLADCTMAEARMFITMLIDFMLDMDVPSKVPLYECHDDVHAYVYACATHKKCAVCGRRAEMHHVDRVGMRALPLCRAHHEEAHRHGDGQLMEKYHLDPVTIDGKIAKAYSLKGE